MHQPCQRHHSARQCHHPAHIHEQAPVFETLQRHAAEICRRPCGRCNTASPLVPSSQHLLQNDAPKRVLVGPCSLPCIETQNHWNYNLHRSSEKEIEKCIYFGYDLGINVE